jgi:hypothetical protein
MKKVTAKKQRFEGPVTVEPRGKSDGTKYSYLAVVDPIKVRTSEGEMLECGLTNKAEFANPATKVAIYVGQATVTWKGQNAATKPKIYFWDDRFWMHARNNSGLDVYRRGRYVLYEVEVENEKAIADILSS